MRILSQLILPRHKYLNIFTLSITKIMCKFAKLTETHQKVDPALIPLSCSNQFQKKITKINFELDEFFCRATKRNIFSNFEQSQCLLWLSLLLTISRHWSKNSATLFYYWNFLKAVVVIRYICNHLQVLFEKDYSKLRWRIPLLDSLFSNKVVGWRPES